MNRIDAKFKELKEKNMPAFIPFLTAGDPNLDATKELILEFDRKGADMIELGVPFSDPIADGPVIQASYYRALSSGIKLSDILQLVKDIRKKSEIPIIAMISQSILFKYGCKEFVKNAVSAGLDGATIPDLPIEEAGEIIEAEKEEDFKVVCFIAPTTTDNRVDLILKKSQGFLYYISVVGITGSKNELSDEIKNNIQKIKKLTNLPVALGFGISTPEQARIAGKIADGVIVGSAIVKEIERFSNQGNSVLVNEVGGFVGELVNSTKCQH
ncbi:tryptophan synthase alpha chain [Candidatus Scalindua japonica]|uniref:Tryptophan synthase alpha chain n=1 Tax=Candidatus Scalindua japonica TaxID=1284222 RepID=A0A286U435_9BACT|nr:tryptophan synthase subunit alpha [Candidatus Scalindua japonica]GAX62885.1 tryptophan synthase alpha chain [Candidatus Scalindua japonica]